VIRLWDLGRRKGADNCQWLSQSLVSIVKGSVQCGTLNVFCVHQLIRRSAMTIKEILEELPNLTQKERRLLRDVLNQEVAQHAGTKARTLESLIDESVRSLKKYKKL
jgi:hypothetical protein